MITMKDSLVLSALVLFLLSPVRGAEIAIFNSSPLVFGVFAAGSGGSVTVDTSGTCSAGGGVTMFAADCSAAVFTVTGDPNLSYVIELPADNTVTLSGPGGDMSITGLSSDPAGASGLLGMNGSQDIAVGGTLNVGNGQAAGSYSGSFSVVVNYN
jgi:hypothetical protein